MNTKILIILLVVTSLILTGCTKTISEITANDDYVDKTVSIKGVVTSSFKLGELSGYMIADANEDTIIVSSERLPAEGNTVFVRGTLKKGPLGIGYYIESSS